MVLGEWRRVGRREGEGDDEFYDRAGGELPRAASRGSIARPWFRRLGDEPGGHRRDHAAEARTRRFGAVSLVEGAVPGLSTVLNVADGGTYVTRFDHKE